MDTFSIYQRGVDAWTMRQIIRQRTQVDKEMPDAPSTLAGRIEWMLNEKRLLQNRWLKVKDLYPDEKRILHEEDVVTYDKVIAHFESLADDAMVGQLRSGSVLGLGYRNRSDSQPVHIPTSDWAFLKLNMRKSDATFEDGG